MAKIEANTFYHKALCKIKSEKREKIHENIPSKMVKFTNFELNSAKVDK